jgi:protein SCO1/2
MNAFLASRYPAITGLTGTRAQIDDVTAAFRVFARRASDADAPDGYVVPHTALTYLLDDKGRYVTHFSDAIPASDLAARLEVILANAPLGE